PVDTTPNWGVVGIHGVPRQRRWDAVATAEAPGLEGDEVHFVALPNGDLIVDEDEPPETLGSLAEAIEASLRAPYRAEAVRQEGDSWGVAASRIRVESFEAAGDELELVAGADERVLRVDGSRVFGSEKALERLGEAEGQHYVVRARRLDGDLWEIEADPL
ncbi:MAG TPA: hypothetical protein VLD16_04245, partial [Gaiellaceae bacterium]|nr:hypothetical protein [Gaiellaceae bacterium]